MLHVKWEEYIVEHVIYIENKTCVLLLLLGYDVLKKAGVCKINKGGRWEQVLTYLRTTDQLISCEKRTKTWS